MYNYTSICTGEPTVNACQDRNNVVNAYNIAVMNFATWKLLRCSQHLIHCGQTFYYCSQLCPHYKMLFLFFGSVTTVLYRISI